MLVTAAWAAAQNPPDPKTQNPPPPAAQDKNKPAAGNTVTLDDPAGAPVSAEEETAYKAFLDAPQTDTAKRIQLGEDFVQKYPDQPLPLGCLFGADRQLSAERSSAKNGRGRG